MLLFPTTTPDKATPSLTDKVLISSTSDWWEAKDTSFQNIIDTFELVTENWSQEMTQKIMTDHTNEIHAKALHFYVKATETILKWQPLSVTWYNIGQAAFEVELANQATWVANWVASEDIANWQFWMMLSSWVIYDINTSAFSEWIILYLDWTWAFQSTVPATWYIQQIAYVLRSHATQWVLQINAQSPLQRIADIPWLQTALDWKVNDTWNETIAWIKTFSSSPIVPTPVWWTDAANKAYADGLVAWLLDYRWAYNASVNTFPASGWSWTAGAVLKGDMWIISVAWTLGWTAVQIWDSVIASIDTPWQTAWNWNILNSNISYVPEDVANKATTMTGNTASNTLYLTAKAIYDWVTTLLLASLTWKTTPVNADWVPIMDSAASNVMKFLSFTNMKAFLKTYFDTLYVSISGALGTPSSWNLSNCTVDWTDQVWFRNCPVNSQSAAYTLVLADAWKTIYHPSADTTARTWTIPSNASVAFPVGTIITFENDISAGALTISITTDTLVLVGAAGSTGSRTLAAGGRAVAQKVTSTRWRIDGNLLT